MRLWDGGMSFHGGVIGVSLGILYMAWRQKLDWLRIHDYVACCVPFGLFLGRLANFVNGELWGGPTSLPWGVVFPSRRPRSSPRHPSQLYEAALEGVLLFLILWLHVLEDPRPLPARQARRHLHPRLRPLPLRWSNSSASPTPISSSSPQATAPAHGPVAVAADDPRRPLSRRSPPAKRAGRVQPASRPMRPTAA